MLTHLQICMQMGDTTGQLHTGPAGGADSAGTGAAAAPGRRGMFGGRRNREVCVKLKVSLCNSDEQARFGRQFASLQFASLHNAKVET